MPLTLAAAATAQHLGLGVAAIEGLHLDKEHVGAGGLVTVGGEHVIADQIARHQRRGRVVRQRGAGFGSHPLEEKHVIGHRRAAGERQRHRLPCAAVDGVAQFHGLQRVVVLRVHPRGHLFNVAGTPVAARTRQDDFRFAVLQPLDEIIIGQTHLFATDTRGNKILTVGDDLEPGASAETVELQRLCVAVQYQLAARQRYVGADFQFDFGAGDGANIAARFHRFRRTMGPFRIVIGQAQVLHVGQIHDVDLIGRAANAGGRYKIVQRFAQREKRELKSVVQPRHVDFLPVTAADPRMHAGTGRVEAFHFRAHPKTATATHQFVTRRHDNALRRQQAGERPAGPQMPHAVVQ